MKKGALALFVIASLLISNYLVLTTFAYNPYPTLTVQFVTYGDGRASLSNISTHSSSNAAMLMLPANASQSSCSMVLYPTNQPLSLLQPFQVYLSFTNALPRFVILLDTNGDSQTDVTLISDYQMAGNGGWQLCQGGQRWGWTNASNTLNTYSNPWENLGYWQTLYGNATVRSVGVALEYWAVADAGGLNQPLYADELILNGITYGIADPNASTSDDWTSYRHDASNAGVSASKASNAVPIWQFNTGDKVRATPTIANEVVYVGSNNGVLYALNAQSGAEIWQYNSGSQIESSAAVANGVVYIGILWDGSHGYVDALNATTGTRIWRFATNSGIESSPTVVNGVVYIGSYSGYVYALNANNGALIWSLLTGGQVFSSPAVVNGVVYIGSGGGYIYALNAATGGIIWTFRTADTVYASPAVVNNIVYVNSDNGTLYAINAATGTEVWRAIFGTGDHADDSPAVANGVVYVGARNGYYAFKASDGSQLWCFSSLYSPRQLSGYVYSSPAVAGGTLYYGSSDSYLFALNATDGSAIWAYRTGGFLFSSPAIANGVVYIGCYDGKIYAFGNPNIDAPAPTLPPQPTPTPTPTTIPLPTSNSSTTQTSTSSSTTTPTQKQTPTVTPTPTPEPQNFTTQNEAQPLAVAGEATKNTELQVNWLILGPIIAAALASIIVVSTKSRKKLARKSSF